MRCPLCKAGQLRRWEGPFDRFGVALIGRGTHCDSCDETFFTHEEVGRQDMCIAAGVVERGIQTGKEFRFIRKKVDLRSNELAALLDVTPETVSRWEKGKLPIPKLAAFALGELYAHPKLTRKRLETLSLASEPARS